MTAIEDFKRDFGDEMLTKVFDRTYTHSDMIQSKIPTEGDQRLYFTLLTFFDFECFNYGDAPKGLDRSLVKAFLKEHFNDIHCEPPSYMGLLSGAFSFLKEAVV